MEDRSATQSFLLMETKGKVTEEFEEDRTNVEGCEKIPERRYASRLMKNG